MFDESILLTLPDLPDEAVMALNDLLERVTACFHDRYYTQLRRAYYDQPTPTCHADQQLLPLDDLPF